jgi:glycosyltransferase 2 family protein
MAENVKKQLVVGVLKYGLGIGLLAWVIWNYWDGTDDSPGLAQALQKPVAVFPLLLAACAYLTGILLTFYRWYVLVRAQGLPFTLAAAMRLGLIGFYLSTFLPGSVGGDIIKAAFIAREQSRRTVAVATVIVDRFIGLCGLFWLVAFVGGFAWLGGFMEEVARDAEAAAYLRMIVLLALGVMAGSFTVWFAAGFVSDEHAERFARGLERIPKLGGALAELWRALHLYRQQGKSVAFTLLISMVAHVGFVLTFYLAAQTLTPPREIPTMTAHFLIVPVGMIVEAGVPSPGGVGGGELIYGWLYKIMGFAVAAGVLGSLVRRVITWALGLLGYLVYLRMKPELPLAAAAAPTTGIEQNPMPEQTAGSPQPFSQEIDKC